jgi:ABC-2 type transport system ATP-binding protein
MEEVAIKVDGVYKDFALPHEKNLSLKSTFLQKVRGGKRTVERQHALKDISFEVKKGEFFGIVGRNGSGKSTLLKILAQIYKPTKGVVSVKGRLVPFIELGVGFNPELTGKDNVYLSASLMGFSRKEIDGMYKDIVDFAELEKFMDQKLKNYSSGMQVRLAFSIATRVDTDILLIDEVLAVGDADFQRKCFDYFKQLKRMNKTVVFVSHDMNAIKEYCDRAVLIEASEIKKIGETTKVSELYTKLFATEQVIKNNTNSDGIWGTMKTVTDSVDTLVSKDKIKITHTLLPKEDTDDAVIGFRLRDAGGKEVLGTNTKHEFIKSGILSKNKKSVVKWEFPNILSDGVYIVDTAILEADNITVIEWFDNAASFMVKKDRHLPYAVDLDYKVVIGN